MVFDLDPAAGGTWELDRTNARYVPEAARDGRSDLYFDHHATCPKAKEWKRPRQKESARSEGS